MDYAGSRSISRVSPEPCRFENRLASDAFIVCWQLIVDTTGLLLCGVSLPHRRRPVPFRRASLRAAWSGEPLETRTGWWSGRFNSWSGFSCSRASACLSQKSFDLRQISSICSCEREDGQRSIQVQTSRLPVLRLTSDRQGPGVVMRKPSSPCFTSEPRTHAGGQGVYLEAIGADGRLRPEIVLELLGEDLLVDVEIGDPVAIHRRRHVGSLAAATFNAHGSMGQLERDYIYVLKIQAIDGSDIGTRTRS